MEKQDRNKPHIFEPGVASLCRVCYRVESDQLHQSQASDILSHSKEAPEQIAKVVGHFHECLVCGRKHYCIEVNCSKPERFICECASVEGFSFSANGVKVTEGTICIGHECVKCSKIWHHDYQCNKPIKLESLCPACLSGADAEINRDQIISQVKSEGFSALSPQEIAEKRLDKESRINLLIRDKDGNLLPDWNEVLTNIINEYRQMQEIARIGEQVGHKILAQSRQAEFEQEIANLSPAEIEQLKRDKAKPRAKKQTAQKIDKDKKKAEKEQYEEMLKVTIQMVMLQKPGLNKAQVKAEAEKQVDVFLGKSKPEEKTVQSKEQAGQN